MTQLEAKIRLEQVKTQVLKEMNEHQKAFNSLNKTYKEYVEKPEHYIAFIIKTNK